MTNDDRRDGARRNLSNKGDPGVAIYPDSDKVGAFPPEKLFRLGDAVDYLDGET